MLLEEVKGGLPASDHAKLLALRKEVQAWGGRYTMATRSSAKIISFGVAPGGGQLALLALQLPDQFSPEIRQARLGEGFGGETDEKTHSRYLLRVYNRTER